MKHVFRLQTGVTLSHDTIRRTLQMKGMHGYRPPRKPLLEPMHKKARLGFARAHAEKDEDYWDSRLWKHEIKIPIFGTN
uniref:Transposase Tc1-like domain-containing protein n=1 Tax=Oryzias sinensis TaxID=183150 RepID=A0A8C7WTV7_9TELE